MNRDGTTVFLLGLTTLVEKSPVPLPFSVTLEYQSALTKALFDEECSPLILDVLLELERYLIDNLRMYWQQLYTENPFLAQYREHELTPVRDYCHLYNLESFGRAVLESRSYARLWNLYFEKSVQTLALIPSHPIVEPLCQFLVFYRLVLQSILRFNP